MERRIIAAALGLSLFGCGSRSPAFETAPNILAVTSVDDRLVLVDSGRNEARLLDVSGTSAPSAPTVVHLVSNPTTVAARNGHTDQFLVLSAGEPDDNAVKPEQPGLQVIGPSGLVKSYPLDSSFNAMTQSADGKYVFLFFDTSSGQAPTTLLFNPNEVALVDLEQQQIYPETLRSFGDTPHKVAFSPSDVPIASGNRRLAVAMFKSSFEIFDLSHLDRARFSVELTPGIQLAQVVFSSTEPKMYFRATGSDDVYVVALGAASPAPAGADAGTPNDFTPSLNQLPAGNGPTDIALYDDGTATRLLALAPGSQQAIIIDADSSNTTAIPLPAPESQILLYDGPRPNDPTTSPRALLYSTNTTVVTFLDLVGIEDRGRLNVDTLTIQQPYGSVVSLDQNLTLFVHENSGLSLLDLGERTVTPITGPNLLSAVPDPIAQKLWLAPPGGQDVAYLDLANGFHPNQVRVDAPIDHLVTVPSPSRPRVVVTHPSTLGYATVLDAKNPTDSSAYAMRGYLFQGILDGRGK